VLQVVGMADRAPLDVKRADAGINRRIELLILTVARPTASPPCSAWPGKRCRATSCTWVNRTREPATPAHKLGLPAKKSGMSMQIKGKGQRMKISSGNTGATVQRRVAPAEAIAENGAAGAAGARRPGRRPAIGRAAAGRKPRAMPKSTRKGSPCCATRWPRANCRSTRRSWRA
jgi:hypothetical protein